MITEKVFNSQDTLFSQFIRRWTTILKIELQAHEHINIVRIWCLAFSKDENYKFQLLQ